MLLILNLNLALSRTGRVILDRCSMRAFATHVDEFTRPRIVSEGKQRICSDVLTCSGLAD